MFYRCGLDSMWIFYLHFLVVFNTFLVEKKHWWKLWFSYYFIPFLSFFVSHSSELFVGQIVFKPLKYFWCGFTLSFKNLTFYLFWFFRPTMSFYILFVFNDFHALKLAYSIKTTYTHINLYKPSCKNPLGARRMRYCKDITLSRHPLNFSNAPQKWVHCQFNIQFLLVIYTNWKKNNLHLLFSEYFNIVSYQV